MSSAVRALVSYADYLAMEEVSEERHEWCDGVVLARAGGTEEHSYLSAAVAAELRAQLRGRPCRSYEANLRLRSKVTGLSTYADASVVCGHREAHPEDRDACCNPTVIVEVLSPSTEGYDRGQKFEHYRTFPSLRHYVLVATGRNHIDHFARNDEGEWILHPHGPGTEIRLTGVDVRLSVDAIYEGVEAVRADDSPSRGSTVR